MLVEGDEGETGGGCEVAVYKTVGLGAIQDYTGSR